jgi:hypothetical protein
VFCAPQFTDAEVPATAPNGGSHATAATAADHHHHHVIAVPHLAGHHDHLHDEDARPPAIAANFVANPAN